MRPYVYFILTLVGTVVYGGQVCPLMESLPDWKLAMVVGSALTAVLGLRGVWEPRYVEDAPLLNRATRQFHLDFGLFFLAAVLGAAILRQFLGFPLYESGLKLGLAMLTFGLFAALDIALAREREVIGIARATRGASRPPRRFASMTRRFSLVAVSVIILMAVVVFLVVARDIQWIAAQPSTRETVLSATRSVLWEILFVMGGLLVLVVNLIISSARNLRLLFESETAVLERVSRGDLSAYAPVATNDELGYIAGHTNAMINGLRDSLRMRKGLEIAREVQINFLPKPPVLHAIEVAGHSLYSDETGGDFYDFVHEGGRLCVMVGDVVGHGVGAALLMATCRAYVRQACHDSSLDASGILKAANSQLYRDVSGTGRFVTTFLVLVDEASGHVDCAGAGHPAALLHTPATGEMRRLRSRDIPLGVDPARLFTSEEVGPSPHERFLVLVTDGVVEARRNGEMFGVERLEDAIRGNAEKGVPDMVEAIIRRV